MVTEFYAWAINTRSDEGHGFIGRFWHFGRPPFIPDQLLGCRTSLFETRAKAREALPHVKCTFPKARVVKVKVTVEEQ